MRIIRLKSFKKDYKKLPKHIQERTNKQLSFLLTSPGHPSLRVKKIRGYPGIWELRVTREYRMTFQIQKDSFVLRRIGTHKVLRKP